MYVVNVDYGTPVFIYSPWLLSFSSVFLENLSNLSLLIPLSSNLRGEIEPFV